MDDLVGDLLCQILNYELIVQIIQSERLNFPIEVLTNLISGILLLAVIIQVSQSRMAVNPDLLGLTCHISSHVHNT